MTIQNAITLNPPVPAGYKVPEQYRYYPNDGQSEMITVKSAHGGMTETVKKVFIATCPICRTQKPGHYYLNQGTNTITSCHECRELDHSKVWDEFNAKRDIDIAAARAAADEIVAKTEVIIPQVTESTNKPQNNELTAIMELITSRFAELSAVVAKQGEQIAQIKTASDQAIAIAPDNIAITPDMRAVAIEHIAKDAPAIEVPQTSAQAAKQAMDATRAALAINDLLPPPAPLAYAGVKNSDRAVASQSFVADANVEHVAVPKANRGDKIKIQASDILQIR